MKQAIDGWLVAHEGSEVTALDVSALTKGPGTPRGGKPDKGRGKGDQGGRSPRWTGGWWSGYADAKDHKKGKGAGKNNNWDNNNL